jgi:OOP family OmpA-OmpF porin
LASKAQGAAWVTLLSTTAACLLLAGCTTGDDAHAPSAPVTSVTSRASTASATGVATPGASPPPTATAPADAVKVERTLRRKLTVPPLPSFALPADLLTQGRGKRIAQDLHLDPGLYRGIAVVDARCRPGQAPRAADAGKVLTGRSAAGHFDDGRRSITVAGNGTGVYNAEGGLHIAILGGGAGVFDDRVTRVQIAGDGSGTYRDAHRRLTVRADGSGSYTDQTSRLWVGAGRSGGYEDPSVRVSIDAAGRITGHGDPTVIAAVADVIADRLPKFPPVPSVVRVKKTGTVCGTVIRLDANVLFDFASAAIRPGAHDLLTRVAALLRHLNDPEAEVAGHTDHIGSTRYNLGLSRRRAEAVRDVLVAQGVPSKSLRTRGFGESRPLRPETRPDGSDDPAARQLDRRVEIVLLGR